jgi:hypothetical protein
MLTVVLLEDWKGIQIYLYEIKVKLPYVIKHSTIKTYGGGGIAPFIVHVSTRWSNLVSFMLQLLYP